MKEKKVFKYNMTLYYQSIVLYLISLLVYALLSAQFSKFEFSSFFKDNIFYLFVVIISYTVISTLTNLIRRKYLSFYPDGFEYMTRIRLKKYSIEDIFSIKIYRENKYHLNGILRTVNIKFINKKPNLIIRPIDYENEIELLNEFKQLREKIGQNRKGKSDAKII